MEKQGKGSTAERRKIESGKNRWWTDTDRSVDPPGLFVEPLAAQSPLQRCRESAMKLNDARPVERPTFDRKEYPGNRQACTMDTVEVDSLHQLLARELP